MNLYTPLFNTLHACEVTNAHQRTTLSLQKDLKGKYSTMTSICIRCISVPNILPDSQRVYLPSIISITTRNKMLNGCGSIYVITPHSSQSSTRVYLTDMLNLIMFNLIIDDLQQLNIATTITTTSAQYSMHEVELVKLLTIKM